MIDHEKDVLMTDLIKCGSSVARSLFLSPPSVATAKQQVRGDFQLA